MVTVKSLPVPAIDDDPAGVVTTISYVPAVNPAGTVACIQLDDCTTKVKLVTGLVLSVTAVAPLKFDPVILIAVVPLLTPEVGDTDSTVGTAKTVKPNAKVPL